jgi:hypothetical protein
MVSKIFLAIAVLSVLLSTVPNASAADADLTPCLSLDWVKCGLNVGTGLFKKYYGTWQNSQDVNAFGTVCKTQFGGLFRRFSWAWNGQFWCPSISATVLGTSEHYKSRDGAIEHAIQNFVQKAGSAGLLTQEQIAQYDKGQ